MRTRPEIPALGGADGSSPPGRAGRGVARAGLGWERGGGGDGLVVSLARSSEVGEGWLSARAVGLSPPPVCWASVRNCE